MHNSIVYVHKTVRIFILVKSNICTHTMQNKKSKYIFAEQHILELEIEAYTMWYIPLNRLAFNKNPKISWTARTSTYLVIIDQEENSSWVNEILTNKHWNIISAFQLLFFVYSGGIHLNFDKYRQFFRLHTIRLNQTYRHICTHAKTMFHFAWNSFLYTYFCSSFNIFRVCTIN